MGEFTLSRSTTVQAPPDTVHPLLDDFRRWRAWSPWEEVDPDLHRDYSGPERGVGARYAWSGDRRAGVGRMEVTGSTPERIDIDLAFEKPFRARNANVFELQPQGGATRVVWTMSGRRNPVMSLMGRLFFDKAIGKDFEKGLARLKSVAESGTDGGTPAGPRH